MSKTLQTIVIRSKYGKIANVFTAVKSMKDLVDETFPKYIEQMQEFASDGKRTEGSSSIWSSTGSPMSTVQSGLEMRLIS